MPTTLTIVGGGLGGLVAAIAAREAGLGVVLHESRKELGGRARTTAGVHRANWGPHVIYSSGPLWGWLVDRGLAQPAGQAPRLSRPAFRVDGRVRLLPPAALLRGILHLRRGAAPVDRSFGDWAAERLGDPAVAARVSNLMGVVTFDHDPGRLSAAFVQERLRRTTTVPPTVRYIPGGWATLVDRLATQARDLGAEIIMSSPVDHLPAAPVILALPLDRAVALLGDSSVRWTGTSTALLDVAMTRRRLDPFIVSDLDGSAWIETFSKADPALAPAGEQLVQAQAGLTEAEPLSSGVGRLEAIFDLAFPDWRERETWRRRMVVTDESGAVDLPGTTWRDRPAIDRGDGVFICGDMVAAPGLLSEVSHHSALEAVAAVVASTKSVGVPTRFDRVG